jgi:glycosyltransferase involved in cell wall biosynthesis
MRKLIIQIPCFNEESILALTLKDLPRSLPGFSSVEWLVIDDGSSDHTLRVAQENGVDHIVRHPRNLGLARAFMTGLDACLSFGADIIVNTDADNQYVAADIPRLIAPIMAGEADIVVGSRDMDAIPDFSFTKKILQKLGSWLVRRISKTNIRDTTSGFRAYSRKAAMQMHVFNNHTYSLETIIQAGQKGMSIRDVSIRTNPPTRKSKLIRSTLGYIARSLLTMFRIFMTYQPFAFFVIPGTLAFLAGLFLGIRYLVFYFTDGGSGHVQSLIFTAILLVLGGTLILASLLADLISVNRLLLERVDWQVQKMGNSVEKNGKTKIG